MTAFLVGGTAFSGTTLLTLLLNQPGIVCLDEPDFQKPEQHHRGIAVPQRLVPDAALPAPPNRALSFGTGLRPVPSLCHRGFPDMARVQDLQLRLCGLWRHLRDIRDVLMRSGAISSARIGLWRTSGATFSAETTETARMMGYGE